MTARLPTFLKGKFETDDIPTQTDYGDVFDSYLNVEVSSATQSIKGEINFLKDINVSGKVSANNVNVATLDVSVANTRRLVLTVESSLAGAGTTQGSAATVSAALSVIKPQGSAADNSFVVKGGYPGNMQYLINDASVSAFIFPPAGASARIDTLSANASKSLGPNSKMILYHVTSAQFFSQSGT